MKSFKIIRKKFLNQDNLIKALTKGLKRRASERGENVCFQVVKEDSATIAFLGTSPAGEDLCFLVDSGLGVNTFFEAIQCMFEYFDVDEHVRMWLNKKANNIPNIPSSLELAQDALHIRDLLELLADDVANMSVMELKPFFESDPYANHKLCAEAYAQLSKLKYKKYYKKNPEA